MMRSVGTPARRAWAIAVSAYSQLGGRVRVAVEREEAPFVDGAARELVVEVLPRRVAVDLDRDH